MQLLLRRSVFAAVPELKRRLLARTVRKVLGVPADYRAGTQRWLAFSDGSIDWNDVRRLIAAVEGAASFPDSQDDDAADAVTLRDWLTTRLPAPPGDSDDPVVLYARPWLRFTTEGLSPIDSELVAAETGVR